MIAVSAAALIFAGTSAAAVAHDEVGGNTITAVDTGHGPRPLRFVGAPEERNPGVYNFNFQNTDNEPHFIAFIKLADEDASRAQVISALDQVHGPQDIGPGKFFTAIGGPPVIVGPGDPPAAGTAHFSTGRWVYFCPFRTTRTSPPHYKLGMLGFTEVDKADRGE